MTVKKIIKGKAVVKIWTNDIADNAIKQLEEMAQMPFIHKHIAAMPDVHWGMGATIGSVIPSIGVIIPAAVGVDLGCGMMAVQTSLKATDLPDNLKPIRLELEAAIPHGRTDNGGKNDKGSWHNIPDEVATHWSKSLAARYEQILVKHPKAKAYNNITQLGTLGTGNHFIEICIDQSQNVWAMLHSGSRGAGNKIGTYFIEQAKKEMERYHVIDYLPNKNLSYLVEHTEIFDDYVNAVNWSQDFAELNRVIMMNKTLSVLKKQIKDFSITAKAINCHHNYVAREKHFNKSVFVTRKGAISARQDELGIIPGSMGAKSYIVRGLGNKDSFCSCSHGAGRQISRNEARQEFTAKDLANQTKGIECPTDESRVDEIPAAYKSIEKVMENQKDLVEIVHTLKQVVNVKG